MRDPAELDHRYKYHPPTMEQTARYVELRASAKVFAETVSKLCPNCREESIAQTHIQEAVMMANASIAITESTD